MQARHGFACFSHLSKRPIAFYPPLCYAGRVMKTAIHPKYYNARVSCACGNKFEVGSTKEKIEVEICSNCHPFYTGKEKLVDTAGRIEKYKRRLAKKTQ